MSLARLASILILVACGKPSTPNRAAQRTDVAQQVPAEVAAQLQPKLTWGGCWTRRSLDGARVLRTPNNAGEPLVPIEFPTTVVIDEWSDGTPDLTLRYQYDARGNILSRETDEGADGLLEQRVVVRRDDNGAITHASRRELFPFKRTEDQSFSFNPYGYLTATDDFYKKRTFAANRVSPVVVAPDGTKVTVGALTFTRDGSGAVVEATNADLGTTQTFSPQGSVISQKTSTGTREVSVDTNGRLVAETNFWDGGKQGRKTSYRYATSGIEIEETDLPAGRCVTRWRVQTDKNGELVGATADVGCDGKDEKTVEAKLDAEGRLISARFGDRSVERTYKDKVLASARFRWGPTYDETITYEYDKAGRLVAQLRPTETRRWTYDRDGRVTSATVDSKEATPITYTIGYRYTAAPLDLAAAPACDGDRNVAGLVMTSDLGVPALDARAPSLFQTDMALNLPALDPILPPHRTTPVPLRELRAAIHKALAREQWTAVRYELVDEGADKDMGKRAGPVAARGVKECPGSLPYYARDKSGDYFELQIEKRCQRTSTSPASDPLDCHWGTQPPEYDLVLHVPSGSSASKARKLVVDLATCVNYTGHAPHVP